jgi:hypothetical protein
VGRGAADGGDRARAYWPRQRSPGARVVCAVALRAEGAAVLGA